MRQVAEHLRPPLLFLETAVNRSALQIRDSSFTFPTHLETAPHCTNCFQISKTSQALASHCLQIKQCLAELPQHLVWSLPLLTATHRQSGCAVLPPPLFWGYCHPGGISRWSTPGTALCAACSNKTSLTGPLPQPCRKGTGPTEVTDFRAHDLFCHYSELLTNRCWEFLYFCKQEGERHLFPYALECCIWRTTYSKKTLLRTK